VTVFNFKHKTEIISLIVIFFALVMYALSKDNLDILSLLIGLSLTAIPFRILYWSEKGSEFFYDNISGVNFFATGMGGGKRDNFLLLHVESGKVHIELIPLLE